VRDALSPAGANRGLGLQVATELAKEPGTRVVVAARSASRAREVAAKLTMPNGVFRPGCAVARKHASPAALASPAGVPVVPLELDVADATSRSGAAARLQHQGVRVVDVLCNNAGTYVPGWNAAAFDACVGVNCLGTVQLTLALLGLLRDGSSVVNVSSGYGMLQFLEGSAYHDLVAHAASLDALAKMPFLTDDAHMLACPPRMGNVYDDDSDRPAAYQVRMPTCAAAYNRA
jgi:NAD(P)-dependent dehydrogenase (short-subunit alcohol dehydrogenase family)